MLLLVLPVLQGDHLASEALEVLIELDDGDRVNEDVDPEAWQLVLLLVKAWNLKQPEAELLHAEVPNAPSDDHSERNE